jgi:hypothetical protein
MFCKWPADEYKNLELLVGLPGGYEGFKAEQLNISTFPCNKTN